MIYGTLETKRLQAEPGNYGRSKELSNGGFVEIETGYYCMRNGYLCYADKTDLSNWVVVCPDPGCEHYENPDCAAGAYADTGMVLENGRFYFMAAIERNRHLYAGGQSDFGAMLCSMAQNGTDMRMEHICEEVLLLKGGDTQGYHVFSGGYIAAKATLNVDGTYSAQLWSITGGQEQLLMEKSYTGDRLPMVDIHSARERYGLRGDRAFCTGMIDGNSFRWLCWIQDGQMQTAEISQIPYPLKYLSGNTIRSYITNDGYYDYDLLTGESRKLAEPQLNNSGAFILQPNCILESTMISSGVPEVEEKKNQTDEHYLMFFDGQDWHEVDLPYEVVSTADTVKLGVLGLFSDCVMFVMDVEGTESIYRMDLSAKHYKLEYCGEFAAE